MDTKPVITKFNDVHIQEQYNCGRLPQQLISQFVCASLKLTRQYQRQQPCPVQAQLPLCNRATFALNVHNEHIPPAATLKCRMY